MAVFYWFLSYINLNFVKKSHFLEYYCSVEYEGKRLRVHRIFFDES